MRLGNGVGQLVNEPIHNSLPRRLLLAGRPRRGVLLAPERPRTSARPSASRRRHHVRPVRVAGGVLCPHRPHPGDVPVRVEADEPAGAAPTIPRPPPRPPRSGRSRSRRGHARCSSVQHAEAAVQLLRLHRCGRPSAGVHSAVVLQAGLRTGRRRRGVIVSADYAAGVRRRAARRAAHAAVGWPRTLVSRCSGPVGHRRRRCRLLLTAVMPNAGLAMVCEHPHVLHWRDVLPAVPDDPGDGLARPGAHAVVQASARCSSSAACGPFCLIPGICAGLRQPRHPLGSPHLVPYWVVGGRRAGVRPAASSPTTPPGPAVSSPHSRRATPASWPRARSRCCCARRRRRLRPGAGAVRRRLRRDGGRDRRAARHQRRRQVDAAEGDQRPRRPHRRRHLLRRRRHHPRRRRRQSASSASCRCPAEAACSRRLTVAENLRLAGWLVPQRSRAPEAGHRARCSSTSRSSRERCDQLAGNLSGGEQQMLALGAGVHRQAQAADDRRAVARPGARRSSSSCSRSCARIHDQRHDDHPRRAVGERRPHARRARRVHGEGRGPLQRPDRRAARARRHPALGVPRRRRGGRSASTATSTRPSATRGRQRRATPGDRATPGRCSRCRGVTKRFGGITRRRRASSFELHEGEILGLIGPNGAGKTTIFDLISGFLAARRRAASSSTATTSPTGRPTTRAVAGLGRSFQDARLFPSLTVRETIAVALERHLDVRDPIAARARPAGVARVGGGRRRGTVDELIELMGLGAFRDKFVARAVDRSRGASSTSPCVHRPRPEGAAARRAVVGHRPAGDRGARPAAAAHPARDRLPRCSSSSTTCRSSRSICRPHGRPRARRRHRPGHARTRCSTTPRSSSPTSAPTRRSSSARGRSEATLHRASTVASAAGDEDRRVRIAWRWPSSSPPRAVVVLGGGLVPGRSLSGLASGYVDRRADRGGQLPAPPNVPAGGMWVSSNTTTALASPPSVSPSTPEKHHQSSSR